MTICPKEYTFRTLFDPLHALAESVASAIRKTGNPCTLAGVACGVCWKSKSVTVLLDKPVRNSNTVLDVKSVRSALISECGYPKNLHLDCFIGVHMQNSILYEYLVVYVCAGEGIGVIRENWITTTGLITID